MTKDFREKLKKLFESSYAAEYRLDTACLLACKTVVASSTSILIYSAREDRLRCKGRYIDEKKGNVKEKGSVKIFDLLKYICAYEYIYSLKAPPSVENAHDLFNDFNQKIVAENCATRDEFLKLVENYEEWKESYEKLKNEYHRESFSVAIETDTVTGEWYKQLYLREKKIPYDILIKDLDDVEEGKKFYCMRNLEKEMEFTFKSKYYVALPLGIGGRNFGVLRFLFPEETGFIKNNHGELQIEAREKELLINMAHDLSLYLEINYFMNRMEIIRAMQKEISGILKEDDRKCCEYMDEFLRIISHKIEKLEIFPHHIIWECVSEKLPENPPGKEKYLLRDVTKVENKNIPFKRNDVFKYPEIECFQLPFNTGEEFTDKVMNYFSAGKLEKIFHLPINEGYSYFNLPIFSGGMPGEDDLTLQWIFTLIYREEDKDLVDGEDFFNFMEFFSDQLSLGCDKFLENIAAKAHKKIDDRISGSNISESPSNEEALKIISRVLASEIRVDCCAFFLFDEQENALQLEFSNIDLSGPLKYNLFSDSNILVTCYEENKTMRVFGREKLRDIANLETLVSSWQDTKLIEHCLCIPITIGKTKLGTIALLRLKPIELHNPGNKCEYIRSPFSEVETNLLEKVQRHIFEIIISYFTLQQRSKDMRNLIEQVTAPVKSLVGHIEDILKGKTAREKVRERLAYMNKLAKISLKYATNFEKTLEFDAQNIHPRKEKLFDLRDYLIGIAMEYQPLIKKKCVGIRITRETVNNINLYVDKDLFSRAIGNIIDNAVKYSFFPEERDMLGYQAKPFDREAEENVLITAVEKNNSVIITISCLGLEILDQEKNKIFERGFRGIKAKERFNIGPGIGLYIAKKIIEAHNGKLELVPQKSKYKGVFRITIPKGAAEQ